MKTLIFRRGKSTINFKAANGDIYDCQVILINDRGEELFKSQYGNADPTLGYKGGRLAPGRYFGIMGYRWKGDGWNGKRVIKMFQTNRPVAGLKHWDISDAEQTLPSTVPNPNHNGMMIMQYVQVHQGGYDSDWSQGCLTVLGAGWEALSQLVQDNEIIIVEVTE